MGHSVRQSVIQLVSRSASQPVSQSRGEAGGKVRGQSLSQSTIPSVESIGFSILLSVSSLFFVIVSTLEIFLANYNDYLPF